MKKFISFLLISAAAATAAFAVAGKTGTSDAASCCSPTASCCAAGNSCCSK